MSSKILLRLCLPIILLVGIYLLGPKPERPKFDKTKFNVPADSKALQGYVRSKQETHLIKPENEAQIIWTDSLNHKTEYVVVYLHGFSASQKEGDPIHRRFAKEFGCNLYLSRLSDHGIDTTEALMLFTADRVWESAKEALAIAKQLGNKVIIMSTSTGGTLALMLAAQYPEDVYALINMSPNIAINNPAAFLLNNPWGLQIARVVMGGKYRGSDSFQTSISSYWNTKYRLESTTELQELLEGQMTAETFSKVNQPSLTLYYYKNEQEQDPEVKVSAMLEMHKQLATPDSLKEIVSIPNAGAHVIGSSLTSKDVEGVYREMERFATEKLGMQKR